MNFVRPHAVSAVAATAVDTLTVAVDSMVLHWIARYPAKQAGRQAGMKADSQSSSPILRILLALLQPLAQTSAARLSAVESRMLCFTAAPSTTPSPYRAFALSSAKARRHKSTCQTIQSLSRHRWAERVFSSKSSFATLMCNIHTYTLRHGTVSCAREHLLVTALILSTKTFIHSLEPLARYHPLIYVALRLPNWADFDWLDRNWLPQRPTWETETIRASI